MFYPKIIISLLNIFDFFQQKKIIKLINNKFTKPIVIFDIGAHHGETIKLFLKKLRVKKIYSFEASPNNYKVLKKKIYKNYLKKVDIYNFGIGDKISKSYINQAVESSSSTMNELNKNSKYLKRKLKILNIKDNENFYRKIPIQILTLDSFIQQHDIQNIDLLKIDTEGYEFNVLKGASKYIDRINLIYFEHHYDDMIIKNYKFSDVHKFLEDKDFKMIKKSKMLFRKSFEYVYQNQKKI